ncbi:MAG: UpxY family transcription antiterminator [Chitinophagaceae bacterium]
MNDSKWFIVYTQPKSEQKLADYFSKKKINNYCPLNRVHINFDDKKKTFYKPLFPSYVFVNLKAGELNDVLNMQGVINFVYWLGKPAEVTNEEIATIRLFVDQYPGVSLEKKGVDVTERIKVFNDAQMSRKGNILEVRNTIIKAQLPSLGVTMIAEIRKEKDENLGSFEAERLLKLISQV